MFAPAGRFEFDLPSGSRTTARSGWDVATDGCILPASTNFDSSTETSLMMFGRSRAIHCLMLIGAVTFCESSERVLVWGQTASPGSAPLRAADRTDSFETKLKLLEEAWARKDFDLARSLTHSLRDTVLQTQIETEPAPDSLVEAGQFHLVESLGNAAAKWAQGWKYYKQISVEERAHEPRTGEPIEIALSFPQDQVTSLAREIRLARIDGDQLVEVPCQVHSELRRGDVRSCRILWLMDSKPRETQRFLVLYGNPNAELPEYPSEMSVEGEGYGLDISNSFYKASLSRQTGQLERLTLRREHGLELFSGGQGHGEPPGIDWAHDYVDKGFFQKLRISLWESCPDYEVIRGPLCTIIRRWGFPHSPVHPIYSPSRLNIHVEYRFYAGLPWFEKRGSMKAVQTFEVEALRDDEWVFSGQSFTDTLWMGRNGKLHTGSVPADQHEDLWGVGFYHKESKDSFVALFLEHHAEGLPELKHTGTPQMFYRWHGPVWSRYPLPVKVVPAGAVLKQKNAYVSIPFSEPEGAATIEQLRRSLLAPLVPAAVDSPVNWKSQPEADSDVANPFNRLARPGEGNEGTAMKQRIWDALRDCKDAQLYKADINVVDLGLVYDVRLRGDGVTVIMAMPHRGRPMLGYFIDGSISVHPTFSLPVRERLMKVPGVRQVVVEQTWDPGWSSNRLTDVGRAKLGLD
ncbi:metal-sulfur cluster assembly factor [Schlesneria sp. DSM 10557]|uniref:metal-sulfur cluster assembly factor n=1 Tax=Schlesneria sp. DSM 10557 TaxID=3044399 RepID=UPI0035A0ED21